MVNKRSFLVATQCLTFNHAPYIEETLNGFTIQETTFSAVFIIVDDASTDGEQELLRNWAVDNLVLEGVDAYSRTREFGEVFFAPHKNRPNLFFVIILLKDNLFAQPQKKQSIVSEWFENVKYLALCEGDDAWIDPLKLQKQVDFLENNPDFALCFGDAIYYDADKHKEKGKISIVFRRQNSRFKGFDKKQSFYHLLCGGGLVPTLTVVFRKSMSDSVRPNSKSFMMGDTPLWLDLSQQGKIMYLDQPLGVYRIHNDSVSHANGRRRMDFDLSKMEMRVYYCKKYSYVIPRSIKKKYNGAYLRLLVRGYGIDSLYGLFPLGRTYNWHLHMIKYNSVYSAVYKTFFFPMEDFFKVIFIKASILFNVLVNYIVHPK